MADYAAVSLAQPVGAATMTGAVAIQAQASPVLVTTQPVVTAQPVVMGQVVGAVGLSQPHERQQQPSDLEGCESRHGDIRGSKCGNTRCLPGAVISTAIGGGVGLFYLLRMIFQ